jgi:dTDP-4-amino-4,6-dideoxygalactose transaminase
VKIKFVDLGRQYDEIGPEIDKAVKTVIAENAFIKGRFARSFEDNFADYIRVGHCIGVGNGTDALFIALKTLGVKAGDEVITAANTFIATVEAISLTGATPVFADCRDDSYNIDPEDVESKLTDKTRALVPVHLYGQPADMDRILHIAAENRLFVVEDAAQAHGAEFKGKKAGTLGDCACFSFYPGKNLGAYGDAGAITTDNSALADRIRMFADHGRSSKYDHEFEGTNSRMDGIQAAVLDVKLKYLDKWTERRREIARRYDSDLENGAVKPYVTDNVRHVYHLYVVRVKGREKLQKVLAEKGIATGIHYPIPIPFLKAYRRLGYKADDFPVAFSLKDKLLSLPIHGSMTDDEVDYVIENFNQALETTGESGKNYGR